MKPFLAILCAVFTFLLVGCVTYPSGLAASSTPVVPGGYKVLGHATGSSTYVSLLNIIPFGHPDYDTAIQDAQRKLGGNGMINVRSYTNSLVLYFLGSVNTLVVEGDVISQ